MRHERLTVSANLGVLMLLAAAVPEARAQVEATQPEAKEKAATAKPVSGTPDRTLFKYNGEPFEVWHAKFATELKPSLRLPALKAIAVFGVNGYADEVTQSFLQVIDSYDESDIERLGPHIEKIAEMAEGGPSVDIEAALEAAVATGIAQAALKQAGATIELSNFGSPSSAHKDGWEEAQLHYALAMNILKVGKRCSLSVLIDAIESDSVTGMGRACAIGLIGEMGPRAGAAIPTLLRIVSNEKETDENRDAAILALNMVQTPTDQIVTALQPLTASQFSSQRAWAATALGKLGDTPNAATPLLIAALNDREPRVVLNASKSLDHGQQFPRDKSRQLLALLAHRDRTIRDEAVRLFQEQGLFHAYRSGDLEEFGISAKELEDARYQDAYFQLLRDASANSAQPTEATLAVIQLVEKTGLSARDISATLKQLAESEKQNPAVRAAARETLRKISPPDAQ